MKCVCTEKMDSAVHVSTVYTLSECQDSPRCQTKVTDTSQKMNGDTEQSVRMNAELQRNKFTGNTCQCECWCQTNTEKCQKV